MKRRTRLRLISGGMLLIAVLFVLCALSNPQLGHVFYIGSFRVGVKECWVFYKLYAAVTVGLFLLSFLVKDGKA